MTSFYIIYPEGDLQEIFGPLNINQLVGINGVPLELPLPDTPTLAYRVYRISRKEERGSLSHFYHLEQLNRIETDSLTGAGGW